MSQLSGIEIEVQSKIKCESLNLRNRKFLKGLWFYNFPNEICANIKAKQIFRLIALYVNKYLCIL